MSKILHCADIGKVLGCATVLVHFVVKLYILQIFMGWNICLVKGEGVG